MIVVMSRDMLEAITETMEQLTERNEWQAGIIQQQQQQLDDVRRVMGRTWHMGAGDPPNTVGTDPALTPVDAAIPVGP